MSVYLEELRNETLRKMEEAIQLLPALRKSAYIEAVQQAPHLVETESPPIRFLRFANGNASEAADLLCSYWELRKAIFVERAFLPLNQTGNGGLDKDDLIHLDMSSFAFLPNSVLFYDPSKNARTSEQSKLRLSFYLWSILSENEESQKQGYVVVVPLVSAKSCANFKVFEDIVFRAMPVRIKRVHLLCCLKQAEMRTFYIKFFPKVIRELVHLLGTKENIHVAVADNLKDFAKVMATHGLPKSGLPEVLGGIWTFRQSFLHWQKERLVLESGRYSKIVPLVPGVSHEKQRSTPRASKDKHKKAGHSVSSWAKPNLLPTSAKYVSASLTREKTGLDESAQSKIHAPVKSTVSETTVSEIRNACTSKALLSSVKEEESAIAKHLGIAREKHRDANDEIPAKLEQGRRELEEALDCIPREERQAYSGALERVPHLVETEPGPLSFLRAENFNAIAAARRMTSFWGLREKLFGDRAFLPMNQTGDGSLSPEDLELMRTGFTMHSGSDSQGRSILVVERTWLEGRRYHETIEKLNRVFFYLAYVAFEGDKVTQKHGMVVLVIVNPLLYRAKGRLTGQALSTCFGPFIGHTVVCHGMLEKQIITDSIVPLLRNAFGDSARQHYIHTGESVAELVTELRSHGIPEKSLPSSLGGPWNVEKFECWCKERVAIERKRTISTQVAGRAGSEAGICEHDLRKSSPGALLAKEQKPTAGSRRRIREADEDLPFPGYDTKKGRRS